jgi:hypothetical protein
MTLCMFVLVEKFIALELSIWYPLQRTGTFTSNAKVTICSTHASTLKRQIVACLFHLSFVRARGLHNYTIFSFLFFNTHEIIVLRSRLNSFYQITRLKRALYFHMDHLPLR